MTLEEKVELLLELAAFITHPYRGLENTKQIARARELVSKLHEQFPTESACRQEPEESKKLGDYLLAPSHSRAERN